MLYSKKKKERKKFKNVKFKVEANPISLNSAYSTGTHGKRFITPEATYFKKYIGYIACEAINEKLTPPFGVSINFYFKNKKRRDLENAAKLILDALTGIAWEDDTEVYVLNLRKQIGVPEVFFEIEIKEMPEEIMYAFPNTNKHIKKKRQEK